MFVLETLISLKDSKDNNLCPCLQDCDTHTYFMKVKSEPWFVESVVDVVVPDLPEERYKRILLFTKTDVLGLYF